MSNLVKMDLERLPERIMDAAWEVIIQKITLAKGLAQVNVLVDTGSLRDSIRVERGGEGQNWRQISLRAGGYVTNPKTGRLVDYAVFVEERHPFLRPAVLEAFQDYQEVTDANVLAKAQPRVRTSCFDFHLSK